MQLSGSFLLFEVQQRGREAAEDREALHRREANVARPVCAHRKNAPERAWWRSAAKRQQGRVLQPRAQYEVGGHAHEAEHAAELAKMQGQLNKVRKQYAELLKVSANGVVKVHGEVMADA